MAGQQVMMIVFLEHVNQKHMVYFFTISCFFFNMFVSLELLVATHSSTSLIFHEHLDFQWGLVSFKGLHIACEPCLIVILIFVAL